MLDEIEEKKQITKRGRKKASDSKDEELLLPQDKFKVAATELDADGMPIIKEPEVQKSLRELLDPNWGKRPKPIKSILPNKKYNVSDRFERR